MKLKSILKAAKIAGEAIKVYDATEGTRVAWGKLKPYMPLVYEIVHTAVQVAPNKTAQEILALSHTLGVPELWGDRSEEEVIRCMAAKAIKLRYPFLPDALVNYAIEAAYCGIKEVSKE